MGEERVTEPCAPCSPQSVERSDCADDCSESENVAATSLLVSVVKAMIRQEDTVYAYANYRPVGCEANSIREKWRQDICHWTYSVVDHFDLSRETVAISLSLFDRYMATEGNKCDGETALLVSLTTLFVSVKLNEIKNIQLNTLSELSREQFTADDIVLMEVRLLKSLSWRVNPPTHVAFVSHLLQFLSPVQPSARRDLFELSRYLCELSLCDSFFVSYRPSSVAYAAILNVFEYMNNTRISTDICKCFIEDLLGLLNLNHDASDVVAARTRMRQMFESSLEMYAQESMLLPESSTDNINKKKEKKRHSSSSSPYGSGGSIDSHSDGGGRPCRRSPPRAQ